MPRATRQVSHSSSSKLAMNNDEHERFARRRAAPEHTAPMQSPVRKLNGGRRPRDSNASILSDDDPPSPGSPSYSDAEDRRPKNPKGKNTLQKQAIHNRRSISGTHAVNINHTPRAVPLRDDDSMPSNLQVVGTSLTPASKKPIPILSNFEDWLKLATDNKINATNSWNFALIDYFHEMSLLRDENGKGINFQKASCTLDGCVKIYGARVESVGVEAGRLLSGLATSAVDDEKKKRRHGDGEEGAEHGEGSDNDDDDDDDESDGEGGKKKKEKKRKARSHEATLAPGFATLQLKKLDLEFAVDPLFKKASADFDEGGAKGLLLNHLSINEEGRIVFDSSDDAGDETKQEEQKGKETEGEQSSKAWDDDEKQEDHPNHVQTREQAPAQHDPPEDAEIDLGSLANKFFPDLALLDALDVCPSMKNFTLGDPTAALSIPLLHGDNDWKAKNPSPEKKAPPPPQIDGELNLADQSGLFIDGSNGIDFDDDEGLGGFDLNRDDVGFGQGGEAWARDAAVEPVPRPLHADEEDQNGDDQDGYAWSMQHRYQEDAEQETMLAFFGKAFNSRAKVGTKAFQTLTNWRITKIQQAAAAENAPPQRPRKEKEPLKIDFHGDMTDNLKRLLAENPVQNDKISLPKTQLKTKGRNLLDKDDEIIDVKALMRLWTKPKCRVSRKKGVMAIIDEGFGARGREQPKLDDGKDDDEDEGGQGDYDANFFADDEPLGLPFDGPLPIDDDDDDDDGAEQPGFVDAREMLSPPPDGQQLPQSLDEAFHGQEQPGPEWLAPSASQPEMVPGSFGSQLVTQQGRRLRPEYVNYARTAKKVDVRALKENMWKGMSSTLNIFSPAELDRAPTPALTDGDGDTSMMDADEPKEREQHESPQTPTPIDGGVLKFTDILGRLKSVYPDQQMKDISTSYGFICLLHLANEKGLVLEGGREEGTMEEIWVKKDASVGEGYVGE